MLIQCPECQFSRTLDESKVPASAQVATCPRCKHRFRFRNQDGSPVSSPLPGEGFVGHGNAPGSGPADNPAQNTGLSQGGRADDGAGDSGYSDSARKQGEGHDSGRDLWDHIASLGEKWEQHKQGHSRHDSGGQQFGSAQYGEEQPGSRAGAVPWEHPEQFGLIGGFFHTVLRVLMRGKLFFSAMPPSRQVGRAILFFFLVATIHLIVGFLWFKFAIRGTEMELAFAETNLVFLVGMFYVYMALIMAMLVVAFSLLFRVGGAKNVTYLRNLRILCYASTGLVLVIIPLIGGIMSSLAVVFSTIQGFACSYNLPMGKAALLIFPVYLLLLLFMASMISAAM